MPDTTPHSDLDPGGRPARSIDPTFERLLENEEQAESKSRRFAILVWACAFTCLVVASFSVLVVRDAGGGVVNAARFTLMVSGVTGMVSLLAASAASLSLLLRSRTPSLRAIDRRLAALETLLAHRG